MEQLRGWVTENKSTMMWWLFWFVFTVAVMFYPIHHDFTADEGYFAEMSARVLRGGRPNIDFATNYLGLMYTWNAFLFSIFGQKLLVMRWGMVFLTATFYTPLLFFISRLMMPVFNAFLATVFVFLLTIGLTHTLSGNWLALYFTLMAVYLLLRSVQRETSIPFVWMGICVGLTGLMKHTLMVEASMALFYMLSFLRLGRPALIEEGLPAVLKQGQFVLGKDKIEAVSKILFYLATMAVPLMAVFFTYHYLDFNRVVFYSLPLALLSLCLVMAVNQHKKPLCFTALLCRFVQIKLAAFVVFSVYFLPVLVQGKFFQVVQEIVFHYPKIYLNFAFVDYFAHVPLWLLGFSACLLALLMVLHQGLKLYVWLPLLIAVVWFAKMQGLDALDFASGINTTVRFLLTLPVVLVSLFMVLICTKYKHVLLEKHFIVLCVFILGLCLWLNTYPLGVLNYWAYSMAPFLLVMMAFFNEVLADKKPALKLFVSVFVLGLITFGSLWLYRQIGLGDKQLPNQQFSVSLNKLTKEPLSVSQTWGEKIKAQLTFIKDYSLREDDVFVYHDEPVLYFWSRHINPTRFSYAIDARLTSGNLIVKDLEKHQVQYVLYDFQQNHFLNPEVNTYLNTYFMPVANLAPNVLAFKRKPKENTKSNTKNNTKRP